MKPRNPRHLVLSVSLLLACRNELPIGEVADGAVADGAAADTTSTGADRNLAPTYGPCTGSPGKPLTAGAYTERAGIATLHWPEPWTAVVTNSPPGAWREYSYVAPGAAAPSSGYAAVSVSPVGVSSDPDGEASFQSWVKWAQDHHGGSRRLELGGHPALLWWDQEPPAQPGAAGNVPLDPGPEIVTLGVEVYLGMVETWGRLLIEGRGSARIDAQPADLFCDIEAMLLGMTWAR